MRFSVENWNYLNVPQWQLGTRIPRALAARASAPHGGPRVADRARPARDPVAARPRARVGQSPRLDKTGLGWGPDRGNCRRPQQNAILFGWLLPNRRPTDAILFHYCSVLSSGSRDSVRTVQHMRPEGRLDVPH